MEQEPFYNMSEGPSVTLYREDIERILLLFREHCKEVKILDRNRVYESLQELENEKGKSPKVLYIKGEKPFAEFSIDPANGSKVWLHGTSESNSENLYFKVRRILDSRQNLISKILTPISSIVFPFVSAISIYIFGPSDVIKLIGVVSLILLAVGGFLFANYLSEGGLSSINLSQKQGSSTFWARNKDPLVVSTIAGVLVVMATAIITYFI